MKPLEFLYLITTIIIFNAVMLTLASSLKQRDLWFYEKLYGKLPFLSKASPTEATILILLLFEVFALAIVLMMHVPLFSILIGTLMIFMLALWTQVASYIAPNIRSLRVPRSEPEKSIMEKYRELLFSSQNIELILALAAFSLLFVYYAFTDWEYFQIWVGGTSWILYAFGIFITWEVSYRGALSLWTSLLAALRSVSLLRASRGKTFLSRYFPYQDIQTMERLDRLNLSFALIAVPLYLVSSIDPLLNLLVAAYLSALILLYLVSALSLKFVKVLPDRVNELLSKAQIGVLGLVDPRNSAPHLTPVAFTHDTFNIYLVTSVVSKKLKIIKQNPEVCFLVDVRGRVKREVAEVKNYGFISAELPLEGEELLSEEAVLINGRAQVLDFLEAFSLGLGMLKIRMAFEKKYPHYVAAYKREEERLPLAWQLKPFVSRLVIKIPIERMIYWDRAKKIWMRL